MKKLYLALVLTFLLVSSAFAGQRYIKFDAQIGGWTATNTITGATSGATATIKAIQDDGTTGILELIQVSGTFQDNEVIHEALGPELVNNGSFTSNADGWTPGSDAVLSSVADGQSGNCLKILNGAGSVGYAGQIVTVASSAVYIVSGYAKNGLSSCKFSADKDAYAYTGDYYGTSMNSGPWKKNIAYLETLTTTLYLSYWLNSATIDYYGQVDEISVKLTAGAALVNSSPFGGARATW